MADEVSAEVTPVSDTPAPETSKEPKPPKTHPDREKIKTYKKQARLEAAHYLIDRKALSSPAELKAFSKSWKQRKKDYKTELKTLDAQERSAHRKAYRAFRRRLSRKRRCSWLVFLVLLLVCLYFVGGPSAAMFMRMRSSQRFSSGGSEADIARANGYALSAEICDEGFVLLKNDGLLPLTEKTLNVFGDDAYSLICSNGSASSDAPSLFTALEQNGIEYNKELDASYHELLAETSGSSHGLKAKLLSFAKHKTGSDDWHMPDSAVISQAKEYSSQALIVLSVPETKGADLALSQLCPASGASAKAQLVDTVCKEFDHVLLIINSGNVMELGFINDYDSIDAVLWVGIPGPQGCLEIAKMLTGEITPSGRTVDTWPVSIAQEPSYPTHSDNPYANEIGLRLLNYDEGIYVGYRYYETRFGADEKEYRRNVVFPFGYGLSYTSFTEEITSFTEEDGILSAEITVTNTGDCDGRDVVELYCMPPWYLGSGVEKSAIELVGFDKTAVLSPGEEETIAISFPVRGMASWSSGSGCYVLEHGEYRIALGKDVHAALCSEDYETYTAEEDIFYRTDDCTGADLSCRFAFAEGESVLSRSSWESTFPAPKEKYLASPEIKQAKREYENAPGIYSSLSSEPKTGAEAELVLADLKGLPYDDEKWEAFLDELTVEDMIRLTANGAWHTEGIDSVGIPASRLVDGPSGITSVFSRIESVAYPAECVLSSSWNTELAASFGHSVASEAKAYGIHGWYAPAANIHRSALGGQNAEYFSEDPYLSGKMAAAAAGAAQENGILAFIRHFVCNDVELNAKNDLSIRVSEQALREIYLRPFEIAVKESSISGIMTSSSRLGVEWCGASSALLQDVLRDEWGFRGVVSSDICLGSPMGAEHAVKNGNDLMFDLGLRQSDRVLRKAYKADPIGTAWALRDSAHNICYALVNSTNLFN